MTPMAAATAAGVGSEISSSVEQLAAGSQEQSAHGNKVAAGIKLADMVGESLKALAEDTDRSVEMTIQIAAAGEEQSFTSMTFSKNAGDILKISSRSAAGIAQITNNAGLRRLTESPINLEYRFNPGDTPDQNGFAY